MEKDFTLELLNIKRSPELSEDVMHEWRAFALDADIKGYSHFDNKYICLKSPVSKAGVSCQGSDQKVKIYEWVMDPSNITAHSFLPFLHRTMITRKVSKSTNKEADHLLDSNNTGNGVQIKVKEREIFYASHFDRCIYQYYAFQLNHFYNQWVAEHNIDDVSIAYRTNCGCSNIEFAKDVIDRIKGFRQCFVLVSDFSNFFDNIDCDYLKSTMCEVLGVDKLEDDWFAVFKSIAKFSWVDMQDIMAILNYKERTKMELIMADRRRALSDDAKPEELAELPVETIYSVSYINQHDLVPSIVKFKHFAKEFNLQREEDEKPVVIRNKFLNERGEFNYKGSARGVPQGASISAVMSNVYMIHFDEAMNALAQKLGGFYRRYSDDIIFVAPVDDELGCKEVYQQLFDCAGEFKDLVFFGEQKTKVLFAQEGAFYSFIPTAGVVDYKQRKALSYLGFLFDGVDVRLRQGAVSKYYHKMRHKSRSYVYQLCQHQQRVPRNLYRLYTNAQSNHKGGTGKKSRGSFITYIDRAQKALHMQDPHVKPLLRDSKRKVAKTIKHFKKKYALV